MTRRCSSSKGGGPHFLHSQVQLLGCTYIQQGANVVRDLRASISAEAGARPTYEALIRPTSTKAPQQTLCHLLTREIIHGTCS
jgi:Mn-containing catalase